MTNKARYRPEKEKERQDIQSAIDKFLAEGGTIDKVDHTANREPVFIENSVIRRGK
jgi:hypothetical protein